MDNLWPPKPKGKNPLGSDQRVGRVRGLLTHDDQVLRTVLLWRELHHCCHYVVLCPQNRLQSIVGVAMPLFHARGVFQYNFGLMPYRKHISTVGMVLTLT